MYRAASILVVILLTVISATPVSAAPAPKEWTLAVFLNADNNLDPFGVEDQLEMSRVGSNDWFNIVTMIDREKGPACINYIEKDKITKVKDLGEVDMGDYRQMVNFMKYVAANYPAKKYIFTIWNHGSGWKAGDPNKIFRGISYDDSSNNHITNAQLGEALNQMKAVIGHRIDILNMDACLMQMAEVVHACKDSVSYIVASEETEPGKGTPYDDVFKFLAKTSTPESFGKQWVKAFVGSYSGGSQGYDDCTQSAIKVAEFGKVLDATNGFCKAIMSGKFSQQFRQVMFKVQAYAEPENIDLLHLVELIKQSIPETGVQTACDKLLQAGKNCIIANGSSGSGLKNSKGLAIYLPSNFLVDTRYKALGWAKDTLWDEMITELKKKETAASLADGLIAGNVDPLRAFANNAAQMPVEIVREVVAELNYQLFVERSVPEKVMAEASDLLVLLKGLLG